jgi:hypothetical protein
MFQNAKVAPQCNPQRKRGRALKKTMNFVFCEALALAYASGYMSQTEELARRVCDGESVSAKRREMYYRAIVTPERDLRNRAAPAAVT